MQNNYIVLSDVISGEPPEQVRIETQVWFNFGYGCVSIRNVLEFLDNASKVEYDVQVGNGIFVNAHITFDSGEGVYVFECNKSRAYFYSSDKVQSKETTSSIRASARSVSEGFQVFPNAILVNKVDGGIVRLSAIEDIRYNMVYTAKSPRGQYMTDSNRFEGEREIGFGMLNNYYGRVTLTELGAKTWSVFNAGKGYWKVHGLD
jgi:hypothetical protein